MKNSLSIFAVAVALMVAQSCGSKSENNREEESAAMETPGTASSDGTTPNDNAASRAEKRAKLQRDIEEWEAKRAIALVELSKIEPTYTDAKGNIIYNKAEVEPSFTGGKGAMMNYLKENLIYPKAAEDKGLEGTIFVDFIVAADGTVREAVVTEATSAEVDQSFRDEALRVVNTMPKWVPGTQRGKAVDVKFSLPVSFQLN